MLALSGKINVNGWRWSGPARQEWGRSGTLNDQSAAVRSWQRHGPCTADVGKVSDAHPSGLQPSKS